MNDNLLKKTNNIDFKAFSIIVPVYNVEQYLKQCLDSIVKQTFEDFEVICINDGSTDNSFNILKEYARKDNRFKLISQENQGQGIARNKGIDIATGKYLLFVDPDDWIEANTLELIYKRAEKCQANVLQFDYDIYNNSKKTHKYKNFYQIAKRKFGYNLKKYDYYNWQIFKKNMFREIGFAVWNKAYLTSYIKKNNIRFAPSKIGEDHIFTIKSVILTHKVHYLNSMLYHYRNRENSSVNCASNNNFSVFVNMQLLKTFLSENDLLNLLNAEFERYKIYNLIHHYSRIPADSTEKYLEECASLLSKNEYKILLKKINHVSLSSGEKFFSIKNNKINGEKFKVLTILGCSFNINKLSSKTKIKLFENKKTNNTTRIISILGIPVYKAEDNEDVRVQHILFNFIYTKKLKSNIKELKTFKIFGVPIFKRITKDDIYNYYSFGILLRRRHLADVFYNNYLKKLKLIYDDVYILHSNSGEVYLFFAYLAKNFLKKNNSQKPLFVATKKYHIDILKLYYPEANYIFINNLRLKTQSNFWKRREHNYYIIFSGNHFEKVESDIKNSNIWGVHYFQSMIKTLNLTEKDYSYPKIFTDNNLLNNLNEKIKGVNLNLNNFVILAPEAMTCTELPKIFWTKLVSKLIYENFDIYLNITNPSNNIAGCKSLDLNYREAYFLALKAKAVISLRSGFSEFLLPTQIPNIALYTKFRNRIKNVFSIDKGLQAFSMYKIPFVKKENIYEINTDNFNNENLLVNQVMNVLNKMVNKREEYLV